MFLVPALGATLMPVLVVLLLPHTRARAKVRPAHIARAGVFSLAWVAFPSLVHLALALSAILVRLFSPASTGARPPNTGMRFALSRVHNTLYSEWRVWMILTLVWLSAWWWFALTRGFKVQSPVLVWLSIALCALLLTQSLLLIDERGNMALLPLRWFL